MTWGLGLEWNAAGSSFQSATPLGQASLSSSPSPAIAPPVNEPCRACLRNQPGAREYWMNRRLHLNMNCWPRLPFRPIWPSSPHCNTVSRSNLPLQAPSVLPSSAGHVRARQLTPLFPHAINGRWTLTQGAASHAHSEPGHATSTQSMPVQSTVAIDSIVWCLPGFVCIVTFSCWLYEEAPESHQM